MYYSALTHLSVPTGKAWIVEFWHRITRKLADLIEIWIIYILSWKQVRVTIDLSRKKTTIKNIKEQQLCIEQFQSNCWPVWLSCLICLAVFVYVFYSFRLRQNFYSPWSIVAVLLLIFVLLISSQFHHFILTKIEANDTQQKMLVALLTNIIILERSCVLNYENQEPLP